jgi:hypothetical protein
MVTDCVKDIRRIGGVLSAAMLAAMLVTNSAAASPVCDIQLHVELTPDIPDPFDSGFLSSLLSNQTGYRVTLLGRRPGSVLVISSLAPVPSTLSGRGRRDAQAGGS